MSAVTIGWIGAGKMGLPICQRLKDANQDVVVLARTDAASKKLKDLGLKSASSIDELCATSQVVFSSITDDEALLEVASSVASAMAKGTTFVDISTVSPSASAELEKLLGEKGIHYLRSPVSGSTAMAQAGTLTAVISGPKSAYDQLAQIFACFTKKTFHVGEAEEARYLKLVLNSMVAATSALLGEALAFGNKGGLSNAIMLDVISQSAVASPLMTYKRDMVVKEDYTAAATLAMLAKDLDLLLAIGRENHTPLPVSANIRQVYEAALAQGLAEKDFFVLIAEAKRNAGR